MSQSGDFVNVIPIMSLYAFAGYRLMPALQGIYGSISQLRFITPALDALHKDLINLKTSKQNLVKIQFYSRNLYF